MPVFVQDATDALTDELLPPLTAAQAALEADRCLECGGFQAPAPCVVACPAEVDVPGFVAAVADGATDAAAATIFAENLLGGTCARVCPGRDALPGRNVIGGALMVGAVYWFVYLRPRRP